MNKKNEILIKMRANILDFLKQLEEHPFESTFARMALKVTEDIMTLTLALEMLVIREMNDAEKETDNE